VLCRTSWVHCKEQALLSIRLWGPFSADVLITSTNDHNIATTSLLGTAQQLNCQQLPLWLQQQNLKAWHIQLITMEYQLFVPSSNSKFINWHTNLVNSYLTCFYSNSNDCAFYNEGATDGCPDLVHRSFSASTVNPTVPSPTAGTALITQAHDASCRFLECASCTDKCKLCLSTTMHRLQTKTTW